MMNPRGPFADRPLPLDAPHAGPQFYYTQGPVPAGTPRSTPWLVPATHPGAPVLSDSPFHNAGERVNDGTPSAQLAPGAGGPMAPASGPLPQLYMPQWQLPYGGWAMQPPGYWPSAGPAPYTFLHHVPGPSALNSGPPYMLPGPAPTSYAPFPPRAPPTPATYHFMAMPSGSSGLDAVPAVPPRGGKATSKGSVVKRKSASNDSGGASRTDGTPPGSSAHRGPFPPPVHELAVVGAVGAAPGRAAGGEAPAGPPSKRRNTSPVPPTADFGDTPPAALPQPQRSAEDNQFQCRFCPYKCAFRSTAIVHERSHTGEKPYGCRFCEYR
jgi:hypothetical protein